MKRHIPVSASGEGDVRCTPAHTGKPGAKLPLLLHIPHSSVRIPGDIRQQMLLTNEELEAELLRMTDRYTEELFAFPASTVRCDFSRLVCDVERFREDSMEPMAAAGMGAVYTRASCGKALRNITPEQREETLTRYYDPHHRTLSAAACGMINTFGCCLIIDCHSFPSVPLPCDLSQKMPRPDICIGTDAFHTPPALAAAISLYFEMKGYSLALNEPFSGALVPSPHYRQDARVASVMIEVRRGLYMDEAAGAKTPGFPLLQRDIRGLLTRIGGMDKKPEGGKHS